MTSTMTPTPHSALYFGAARNFWWNDDFVRLLAARWDLRGTARVLDVGCGIGHWGRTLSMVLPPEASVVGVDREAEWVERATAIAKRAALSNQFSYQVADAHALPFAAGEFDLVTCQTVLIHVPDVAKALTEMLRVLRPGGLLVAIEPNNLAASTLLGDSSLRTRRADWLKLIELQLTCEQGKARLGLGDNSVGDLVPGILQTLGCREIHVCLSDKCSTLVPPYDSEEQAALEEGLRDESDVWIWERSEAERYFLAGGGARSDFDALWALARSSSKETADSVTQRHFHTAGGCVMYVIDCRKPI
jgi:SAM-dependent methyltransferase